MATRPVRSSVQAEADLIDIWTSIAPHDPKAADRVLDRIAGRIDQLAEYPHLGRLRPDIRPDLRVLVAAPYLVFFRRDEAVVEIVRVVHGARDLVALDFEADEPHR